MKVSKEFYARNFSDDNPKKAYLDACEWIAKNVLSNKSEVEVSKVTWNISRQNKDLPTFRLVMYVTYDEEDMKESMCNICKEMHASFYINENFNCDRCNMLTYRRRNEQKLDTGCEWFKSKINKALTTYSK